MQLVLPTYAHSVFTIPLPCCSNTPPRPLSHILLLLLLLRPFHFYLSDIYRIVVVNLCCYTPIESTGSEGHYSLGSLYILFLCEDKPTKWTCRCRRRGLFSTHKIMRNIVQANKHLNLRGTLCKCQFANYTCPPSSSSSSSSSSSQQQHPPPIHLIKAFNEITTEAMRLVVFVCMA